MATRLLDSEALDEVVREWAVESGTRARLRRKALKFTQQQLADLAGSTPETICRIELGQLQPREPLKLAVSYALLVDVEEIWPPVARQFIADRASEPTFALEDKAS